ncbi:hypothetical protein [Nostoc sp. UHCC 0870]|uniref:hypothetical protein n=1 Tax=Nostoc sp. UHCC 0870 TaxID=2914041 RepID=UPI001EDD1C82|nr:hypothetical protein [Nostoc sp. UHCC 0870]UKO98708.1 hypothetical protein L6494_02940 [Nostoc sp. UHCC 0870]
MASTDNLDNKLNIDTTNLSEELAGQKAEETKFARVLKKIRGGFFLAFGYMLSPLSWWNDLFFNLPIAYGFGYICSLLNKDLLIPCAIAGYWLSNVVGILLMQVGVVDVFQNQPQERNLKKELLMGLASSTVYTLVILALIQLKILDTPDLFPGS